MFEVADAARRENTSTLNTSDLFLTWGNALWAARKFDDAVEKYLTVGEIAPGEGTPLLNAAIALLDKVSYGTSSEEPALFEALQAVADHLSWQSSGGPYAYYTSKIRAALNSSNPGQSSARGKDFDDCLKKYEPNSAGDSLLERAQLKICVDQAMHSMISTPKRTATFTASP